MSPVIALMQDYNKAIKRYHKAEAYFEQHKDNLIEIDKHIPSFKTLVNYINGMNKKMKKFGYEMTDEETLYGFRQVEYMEKMGELKQIMLKEA